MAFEQATIPVEKQDTFAALKARVESALGPNGIDNFMKGVARSGYPVRKFEQLLSGGLFDGRDSTLKAARLYAELGDSDKGLIREFYLTRIEQVPDAIREKYSKIYRYA
jgi:hypothetical protein